MHHSLTNHTGTLQYATEIVFTISILVLTFALLGFSGNNDDTWNNVYDNGHNEMTVAVVVRDECLLSEARVRWFPPDLLSV